MEDQTLAPSAVEMESETQQPPAEMGAETQPPPPLPACVSKVLDDDNLLTEIIVRVGFPTSLVRAAAVCRRWFGLASAHAFLRRFRELHSPRPLGFYLAQEEYVDAVARFFPMLPQPPPPEQDSVVRRSSFSLDLYKGAWTDMVGCWNGRVVTRKYVFSHHNDNELRIGIVFVVHSPLRSERGMPVIPTLHLSLQGFCGYSQLLVKENGDVLSFFYVMVECTSDETNSTLRVYILQNGDDVWRTHLTLALDCPFYPTSRRHSLLVDNKIYMASTGEEIVVLDLTSSSLSTFQLPQRVDFNTTCITMLSSADDASGVYFMHLKEFQLQIWIQKGGNWLLVDNMCLREMCASFLEDDPTALLEINHHGDYSAEFLFLEMGRFALYLDVKCRTLRKVYEMTREDEFLGCIYPFMMTWPPIFPALKDGPASNAT